MSEHRAVIVLDGQVTGGYRQVGRSLAEIRGEARSTVGQLGSAATASDRFGASASRLSGGLVGLRGAFAALGIAVAVRQLSDARVAADQIDAKLKLLTGSTSGAAGEFGFLREESYRLGLSLQGAANQYSSFAVAASKAGIGAGDTRNIFLGIAEAASAMGLTIHQQDRAFVALQQMASKTKINMEELTGQLGEHIPGALAIMAESMGKSLPELLKLASEGKLLAADVLPAFGQALRDNFGKAATEAAGNLQAQKNRIASAWFEIRANASEAGGVLTGVFRLIANGLKWLADNWHAMAASIYLTLAQITRGVTSWASGIVTTLMTVPRAMAAVTPDAISKWDNVVRKLEGIRGSIRDFGGNLAEAFDDRANDRIARQAGLVGELVDVFATAGDPGGPIDKADKKLASLLSRFTESQAILGLSIKQQHEISELYRTTPYEEVEEKLRRLNVEHEVQKAVLQAEIQYAYLGIETAQAFAAAIGEQTRAFELAKFQNEDYARSAEEAAEAQKRLADAIADIPELSRGELRLVQEIDTTDIRAVLEITRALRTPAEEYKREVAEVERLMAKMPEWADQLQAHLVRMRQEWNGYRTIAAGALRATGDLAKNVFSEIISGGEISWRSVADSLIRIWADAMADLLRQWIANLIRMKAAEAAAGLGSTAMGVGFGGSGAGAFGALGNMGAAAYGAQGGGGWMAGLSSGVIAGAAFAALAAYIAYKGFVEKDYEEGGARIGGMGTASVSGTYGDSGYARSSLEKARQVVDAINQIADDFGLAMEEIGRVTIGKANGKYFVEAANGVRMAFETAEQAMAAATIAAIKTARFGEEVSQLTREIIAKSSTRDLDQFRADLGLAQELEGLGVADVFKGFDAAMDKLDAMAARIVELGLSSEVTADALARINRARLDEIATLRDQITGRQRTEEEDYQERLRMAEEFNRRLRERDAESRAREADLLTRIERFMGLAMENMGRVAEEFGRASGIGTNVIEEMIRRWQDEIDALRRDREAAPPPIDPGEIIRRPRGGGGSGGADREQQRADLRREADRFGIGEVAAALVEAADRHREYAERVRESGLKGAEAARLIQKSEDELARARKRIVQDQRRASGEFFFRGTAWGGDLMQGLADINAEMNRLLQGNRDLYEEGQINLAEMRELNRAIREAGERQRQALGKQAELGLLAELYNLLGMTKEAAQLEWELKVAGLEIALAELRIAEQTYGLRFDFLDEIDALIKKYKAQGPPTGAGGGPTPSGSLYNQRMDEMTRLQEEQAQRVRDAMADLEDLERAGVDAFTREVTELADRVARIGEVLGHSERLERAHAVALQEILDRHLGPIRRLQEDLLGGADSPLRTQERYELAKGRFFGAVSAIEAGDLAKIGDIPKLVSDLLPLLREVSPKGSTGYRGVFGDIYDALGRLGALGGSTPLPSGLSLENLLFPSQFALPGAPTIPSSETFAPVVSALTGHSDRQIVELRLIREAVAQTALEAVKIRKNTYDLVAAGGPI